ncbi:MAG: putative ABC exporter domain-containing protein [Clostridiales bacterium]|nr:putative ABC exporter domain-containing protein [Clostridiales bacterium]
MRLFFYYTWHSLVNTLKKIFKTWLAFFAVCLVLGMLIGFGIGILLPDSDDEKESDSKTSAELVIEDEDDSSVKVDEDGVTISVSAKSGTPGFLKSRDKKVVDLIDLIISVLFFLSLAINISNAKSSGRIFKPADVPMLFASPMKPQSVLMFRLVGTLAASLAISLYMVFQLPNLIYNVGLGGWGAASLIIAYGLSLIFGTLVQVAFYTIMSKTKYGTGGLGKAVICVYAVIAGVFGVYMVASGKDALTAAFDFFGSKYTFWVPFWGWMRGFCYYAISGEMALSLLFLTLFVFACALIVVVIWKVKADFYEDALVETDKQAALLENAKKASSGVVTVRDKDRSEKLQRDGFNRGSGAGVFLFKAVYNRFRFAKFHVFNATLVTFTLVAGFAAWLAGRSHTGFEPFLVPACVLTVLMFYRTLGNPLKEDTSREFFILIPEPPMKKLWFSLLGSVAVNAIDLLPAILVAGIILRTSPLVMLGWYIFILSVSFFGTAVGAFVNISVPGESGSTIKTFVQIMFLYFGLLPAAVFIILGIVLKMPLLTLLLGSAVSCGLGALFVLITPHFLVNR